MSGKNYSVSNFKQIPKNNKTGDLMNQRNYEEVYKTCITEKPQITFVTSGTIITNDIQLCPSKKDDNTFNNFVDQVGEKKRMVELNLILLLVVCVMYSRTNFLCINSSVLLFFCLFVITTFALLSTYFPSF